MSQNSNEPAFPRVVETKDIYGSPIVNEYFGLTKREYFAGLAMQGLCANPNIKHPHSRDVNFEEDKIIYAKVCLEYADNLLKQLDEKIA